MKASLRQYWNLLVRYLASQRLAATSDRSKRRNTVAFFKVLAVLGMWLKTTATRQWPHTDFRGFVQASQMLAVDAKLAEARSVLAEQTSEV